MALPKKRKLLRFLGFAVATLIICTFAAEHLLYSPVDAGVTTGSANLNIRQITSGGDYSCGIASDGKAYCWGSNIYGQLGNGSNSSSSIPVAVSTTGVLAGKTIVAISAGVRHTCAIASDNLAYCWGAGYNGQLGRNSQADSNVPVAVSTTGVLAGKTIKNISVGSDHACAIASDNLAYCWGLNTYGQIGNNLTADSLAPVAVYTSGVLAGKTIMSVVAATNFSCAIASDNLAYCWGRNNQGQLGDNTLVDKLVPVAVYTAGVLSGKTMLSISASGVSTDSHTCAVASDRKAYCWGRNYYGELGDNSTTDRRVPVAVNVAGVLAGKNIVAISAGGVYTCALASDNKVYCWGYNANGELGNNSTTNSSIPVAVNFTGVLSGKTINTLEVQGSSCAVASDNLAYCWGFGTSGQLGNGATTSSSIPVAVSLVTQSISVLLDQSVYRTYNNSSVAAPGAPLASTNTPAALPSVAQPFRLRFGVTSKPAISPFIQQIDTGGSSSCAIARDNAYCWGLNTNGQLGNNSTTSSPIPVPVYSFGALSGKTVKAISAGNSHSCAVASDNLAYCWGLNTNGQLGNSSTAQSSLPVAVNTAGVLSGKTIISISVGDAHTCAVASDNNAYCWGLNTNGRLGNTSTTQSLIPVAVTTTGTLSGKTIKAISVGSTHTCVIASDNLAYCWGTGSNGQLGNNATTAQNTAAVAVNTAGVLSGKTIKAISAGNAYTCAIASDNNAYCWGLNTNGRLGNNSTTQSTVPVAVNVAGALSGKTLISIYAGDSHTCAVASDNQNYCWGAGANGRLGNNATADSLVPAVSNVLSGLTSKAVAAGGGHTCAIASDNLAYCWGAGTSGQLGNNLSTDSLIPAKIETTPLSDESLLIVAQSNLKLRLQYAPKQAAATCSAVSTGWVNVTGSSLISYDDAAPNDGLAIGSLGGSDPTLPSSSSAYSYQTTVRGTGSSAYTFTNGASSVKLGQTGIWDFVLRDRTATNGAKYCFRLVTDTAAAPGTSVDSYLQYPEITTAAGDLGVRFTDNSSATLANPTTAFSGSAFPSSMQTTTAALSNNSSQQLEVSNSASSSGWSIALAATDGPSANWLRADPGASFPYNSTTAASGRLSVNTSAGTFAASGTTPSGMACSTTGLTFGGNQSFQAGTTNAITLATASSTSGFNCTFKLQNINLSQTIPQYQLPGIYSMKVTVTVMVQ